MWGDEARSLILLTNRVYIVPGLVAAVANTTLRPSDCCVALLISTDGEMR